MVFLGPLTGALSAADSDGWLASGEYFALSRAVDLDGDGLHDLVVGGADTVHIIPGPATGALVPSVTVTTDKDVRVTSAGDVNVDGYEDLLVGSATGVHLFHGPISTSTDTSSADATLLSDSGIAAVVGGQDLDGDTFLDVSVLEDMGILILVPGPLLGTIALADAGVAWSTDAVSLDNAGDTDGDGRGEVVFSHAEFDSSMNLYGVVALGASDGWVMLLGQEP